MPGDPIYLMVYELSKRKIKPVLGELAGTAVAGGLGGVAFWMVVYPIDMIKTNLQSDFLNESRRSIRSCVKSTYKTHGLYGFYRGVSISLLRAFPVNACGFVAFEYGQKLLIK
eukprot:TRINITY_DN6511_c0_g1_i1.p1 TRINITY_DN6511_c0_g1~~TRINITY_DN6511_c0_g1_i1.p1  ORF type:complete len:113 (-),score=16.12 TRINITY_DN6511_c0_g1_i1:54-392(-)